MIHLELKDIRYNNSPKSGIYIITNLVNGKFYIGSASHLSVRWNYHKFKMNKNLSDCKILQKAWNKYGEENFTFRIIELVEDKTKLLEREQFYLDTMKPVYNILKIAGSNLGIKRSKETLKRMSAARKGKYFNPLKPVLQYDLSGNFIKEWDSPISIIRNSDFHSTQHITECCRGKRKTAYKFIWKYKNLL